MLLVVAAGQLAAPRPAVAQPAEPAAPTEPSPQETAPVTLQPAPPSPIGPLLGEPLDRAGFHWKLIGYLRLQYLVVQDDPNVAYVGRNDGFELQNAVIGMQGQYGRAAIVVAVDGALDERVQVNATDGRLRIGLRAAYGELRLAGGPPRPYLDTRAIYIPPYGTLAVRGGLFEPWVDPEALVTDTGRAFVDLPIESRGVRATQGYETASLTPGRSLGVALRLDPNLDQFRRLKLGFEIAIVNGAEELASNNDNDKPAISATALARRGDSWLMIAGRYNPRSVGALPFRQDEEDLQITAGGHLAIGPLAVSAGAIAQRTRFPTTGGPVENGYGGHGQAMFARPLERGIPDDKDAMSLAVGYRFGILDPSSLISTDRVMEHTACGVLAVPRYRMRVQLQATHTVEQAARELSNSRVQLAAELVL